MICACYGFSSSQNGKLTTTLALRFAMTDVRLIQSTRATVRFTVYVDNTFRSANAERQQ